MNRPLPRYRAKRVRHNRKMLYQIEGCRYPGVTKILSATKPAAVREALWRWRQSVGPQAAKQISGQASSVGTRLHQQIAAHLNGEAVVIPADIAGYWHSMAPVLADVEEVLLVEGAVWHSAGFIGFPDALVIYQGSLCLCDWKTARRPKRSEWVEDYFLQIAAYRAAAMQVYADWGLTIERGLVAIALDHTPAQLFEIFDADLDVYWQRFQHRLCQFYQQQSTLN